jgi:large subunit ribosomal protein L13
MKKATDKKIIKRQYHLFDLDGKIMGRAATVIARILSGKNKVSFTPNIDGGDFVVVINTDRLVMTGRKLKGKIYHRFSGYPGGITSTMLADQLKKDSRKVVTGAIYGMLPKNKLRKKMMRRLLVYKNSEHKHKIDITH